MVQNLFVYEILAAAVQLSPNRQAQVGYLRAHSSDGLRMVLRCLYDRSMTWIKRVPTYRPDDSPIGLSLSHLLQEYKRLYMFTEPNTKVLGLSKQLRNLTMMLETLPKQEAKIVEDIVMEKGEYPGLSIDIVKEAFPDLLQ